MRQFEKRARRAHGPRKWASVIAAGAVATLVFTGCADSSEQPSREDGPNTPALRTAEPGQAESMDVPEELSVGVVGQIASLNPADNVESGLYSNTNLLEPLLRIDENGDLQPWLATKFEKVSDTEYLYTLREGVTFWDGSALTADDVAFSWMRLVDDEIPNQFFASVASIEAVDDQVVRVTLSAPDASWQYTPAMFYSVVYQRAHFESNPETFGQPGTLVMGTGPYTIDSFDPNTGLELSANPEYWGGEPPITKLSFTSFADDNSMGLALRAGEIALSPFLNDPQSFAAASGTDSVTTIPTCSTAFISMPTQTGPWDDVHIRRAVAHAIDREDIIAATRGRTGGPADLMMSPITMQGLGTEDEVDAALDPVQRRGLDLDTARAELEKSSQPDGFDAEIIVEAKNAAVAQVIAAQLAELDIDVTITTAGPVEYIGLITGPEETRPFTFTEVGACTPDPSWNKAFFASGPGLNVAAWYSPEVDQLLADALVSSDPSARLGMYTEILEKAADEVPYIPLYAEGRSYGSKDLTISGFDSFFLNMPWVLNLAGNS